MWRNLSGSACLLVYLMPFYVMVITGLAHEDVNVTYVGIAQRNLLWCLLKPAKVVFNFWNSVDHCSSR
jgi:hypothetical protein